MLWGEWVNVPPVGLDDGAPTSTVTILQCIELKINNDSDKKG